MTRTIAFVPLEVFLQQPETQPPQEYIAGEISPKPMPTTRHARLQSKLVGAINGVAEPSKVAYGFPELRCTFGDRSLVPDLAVLRWSNIPFDEQGEPLDDITIAPDWTIEILSPGQSANRVASNILYALEFGTELGWLIDPDDRSVLIFLPQQQPLFCRGSDRLLVLQDIELELDSDQLFSWLKMN
jgi:Uma2 family endonuclease